MRRQGNLVGVGRGGELGGPRRPRRLRPPGGHRVLQGRLPPVGRRPVIPASSGRESGEQVRQLPGVWEAALTGTELVDAEHGLASSSHGPPIAYVDRHGGHEDQSDQHGRTSQQYPSHRHVNNRSRRARGISCHARSTQLLMESTSRRSRSLFSCSTSASPLLRIRMSGPRCVCDHLTRPP